MSLYNLIKQGEHQEQDFKHSIGNQKKIAITLSAFANTNGGRLLIGVKDSGKIVGVRPAEEYHMIEGAAQVFCKPEIEFDYKIHKTDGKQVLEVYVPPGNNKPYLAKADDGKWLGYLRVDDENFLSDPVLLQYWRDNNETRKTFIKYTEDDKHLMILMEAKPSITYKKLCKNTDVARVKITHSLAKLLRWQIIDYEVDENGIYYFLL